MRFSSISILSAISVLAFSGCKPTQTTVNTSSPEESRQVNVILASLDKEEHRTVTAMEPKEIILPETKEKIVEEPLYSLADEIVTLAKEFLGIRYKAGGTGASGMDCSGMVWATFSKKDITVPRSSGALAHHGYKIKKSEAKPGDLIFFRTNGRKTINHVGIITEVTDNDIKFIHASVHRGVIVSSLAEAYYTKAFVQINRVLE